MISVKVVAVMELAAVLEGRQQEVSLPEGARVSELLAELERKYGESFTRIIYGGQRQPEHVLVLNGRSIAFLEGLKTELHDGDQLFFLSPAGGG